MRTFSKSRSLAGGRLGFAIADSKLINDLRAVKNSLAPYNINSMTQAAAIGALEDAKYFNDNIKAIIKAREFTLESLKALNFKAFNSLGNFVFASHEGISGAKLFDELSKRKILVRHFSKPERISNFIRITIGKLDEMQIFIESVKEILNEDC